jgi:ubiquitin carboxyl-terminal hydrolase L3
MNAGSAPPPKHRKHFIPLDLSPQVFTELIHKFGVSDSLKFEDVLSLDNPGLLAFLPRRAYALILVFPTTLVYKGRLYNKTAE